MKSIVSTLFILKINFLFSIKLSDTSPFARHFSATKSAKCFYFPNALPPLPPVHKCYHWSRLKVPFPFRLRD